MWILVYYYIIFVLDFVDFEFIILMYMEIVKMFDEVLEWVFEREGLNVKVIVIWDGLFVIVE